LGVGGWEFAAAPNGKIRRSMNKKILLCVVALSAASVVMGCRKPPAGDAPASGAQGTGAAPAAGQGAPAVQPAAPAKPVPAQLPDVVARVNGEAVKKADFERMLKTIEARAGQPIPPDQRDRVLRDALDQLIVYTLLSQESQKRGVKVDTAEIDAKMGQLKSQFPTQEAFEKALKDRGMTAESLRKDAQVDLSVTKLMDTEVAAIPAPSDADARDFYDKNQDKFKEGRRSARAISSSAWTRRPTRRRNRRPAPRSTACSRRSKAAAISPSWRRSTRRTAAPRRAAT
jgi:parvulin-like peptidyl-prolyl isomerase